MNSVQRNPESGITLIELFIALAIATLVMSGIVSVAKSMMDGSRKIGLRTDREQVRNLIRSKFDCVTTKAALPTQTTTFKVLLDSLGRPIAPPDSSGAMIVGGPPRQWKIQVVSHNGTTGAFDIKIVAPDGTQADLFKNVPLTCR